MTIHGIEPPPLIYSGDFTKDGGVRTVRQFLKADPKPTAIVSLNNNRMSLGVLLELVRCGQHIPGDMAVASFGEVEAGPLLSQNPYDMGKKAGEILLGRIRKDSLAEGPVTEIFSNELKLIP